MGTELTAAAGSGPPTVTPSNSTSNPRFFPGFVSHCLVVQAAAVHLLVVHLLTAHLFVHDIVHLVDSQRLTDDETLGE